MRLSRRAAALAVLSLPLAGAGCAPSRAAPEGPAVQGRVARPDAGDPFRLALGATAERDGHRVRFVEVVEDSRCPQGTACVTEGRARLRIEVDGRPFVLSVPHARMADDEASMVEWGEVQVVVLDLEPGAVPRAVLVVRPSSV